MSDPRLHILHLSSPALPVGAYAYSQGLEFAIEEGWLDGERLEHWLRDSLQLGLGYLDLPILARCLKALRRGDDAGLDTWNDYLLANRETHELLLEDQQIGAALWRLLGKLEGSDLPVLQQTPGYAAAFAVACARWNIDEETALFGYCYSWLENQVTAATKLVPLGQTDAQKLLLTLMEDVPDVCNAAQALGDENLGMSLTGLAIASCRHEHQHTRLFRS